MKTSDTCVKTYYDACALDYEPKIIQEISSNYGENHKSIISHFALGEAYGNSLNKDKQDKGKRADAFLKLIQDLGPFIDIVGNDGEKIESLIVSIKDILPKISIADAMHIATAISCSCTTFRTRDHELCELEKNSRLSLAVELGVGSFKLSEIIQPIPKSSYFKKVIKRGFLAKK